MMGARVSPPAATCARTRSCSGRYDLEHGWTELIDHFFAAADAGNRYRVEPRRFERGFTEPWHGEPLSDHESVEVDYELNW